MLIKWVKRKIRSCFDKALLSVVEGLSTNGFYAFQLIFLGSCIHIHVTGYWHPCQYDGASRSILL